jgi:LCP family protein required for cell wall assembly
MNDSDSTISRRRRSALRQGAALAFAGIIASSLFTSGPAPARAAVDASAAGQALDAPLAFTEAQSRRILGTDGRFTILLLGSDGRKGRLISRTDAIMVASVDPVSGRAAIFSIPRDTVRFPLSATRRFAGKINAILPTLAGSSTAKGTALRKIIGRAFGIEIDAYALIGFVGFRKLVNNVEGVRVYVPKTFRDRTYSMRKGQRGVTFTKGWQTLLDLRALAYARTRHADSDYARSRRQQQLVVAAIQKVQSRTVARLAGLLAASSGLIKTDLPLADAEYIFAVVGRADLAHAPRVVFGPRTYASAVTSASIVLKMSVCKTWIRRNFPLIRTNGTWLPPEPPPAP